MENKKRIPLEDIKPSEFKPTPEMVTAAKMVLIYTAQAQAVRPIVEAYEKKNLDIIKPKNDNGETIADIRQSYRMNETDFKKYMELNEADRIKHGLSIGDHPAGSGYCPLLIAENDQSKAEGLLIDTFKELSGGVYAQSSFYYKGKNMRPEYVRLLLCLVCTAANIKKDDFIRPAVKGGLKKIMEIITADYKFNEKYGLSLEPEVVCKNAFIQLKATGLTAAGANLVINTALESINFLNVK